MSEVPLCSIVLAPQLSAAAVADLELALQSNAFQIQKPPQRVLGADDVLLVMAVVSGAAAAAQLLDYGIKATKAIGAWRRQQRAKGEDADCILQHPDKPPLDLRKATDEEIEAWFTR